MSSGSRKRTVAPRDEGDPATFLDEYFRDRGISGRHDSEAAREVQMRAEQARERFKRMRTEAASSASSTAATNATNAATSAATGLDADTLTKEQKYNRRLANNRKSAAASRVYNEVLRKETDFTLKEVVEKAKHYKDTITNMNKQLSETQKENERMKKRIAKLEQAMGKSGTAASAIVKIDDDDSEMGIGTVKKEETCIANANSNITNSGGANTRTAPVSASSILSGAAISIGGSGSAITSGSGTGSGTGSIVPRMPTLSQASSARTHGATPSSHSGCVSNLPRLPPLHRVPGEFPVIPALFGAGTNASNTILRLSQSSTPSGSQEEEHNNNSIPQYNYNSGNSGSRAGVPVQQLITRMGSFGGSQEARFSYPASQDHPPVHTPVQQFSLSQDLTKNLHLGSQEPEQSHRMSQEIIGADVAPSQS